MSIYDQILTSICKSGVRVVESVIKLIWLLLDPDPDPDPVPDPDPDPEEQDHSGSATMRINKSAYLKGCPTHV
jgi:hypothetical protein